MNAEERARCKMRQQFLLFPFLLLRAASVQVTGLGKTTVDYGMDAFYKCELHDQKGVQQVTWQRRLRDNRLENVASYSKVHGQHINEPYRGKVILNETSLTSASLTLKSATWADECCYICIFNVFPEPSKRKQTCLTVQGISEVNAMVDQADSGLTNGTRTVVFSCSATGKPPPFIRWDFSHNATILNKTVSTTVGNEDGTFTSAGNVTVLMLGSWDGHADCVVQSGSHKRMVRVPFSWDATSLEEEDTGGAPPKTGVILTGIGVIAVIGVIGGIGVMVLVVRGVRIGRKPKRLWKRIALGVVKLSWLSWLKQDERQSGEVLASAAEIAEAGRPLLLGCNVSTTMSDAVHQVRWLDKDNKLLLAYQPGASVRVSHQDSNVQLVSWQKNSSSITILEVRLEHDGCFRCIFDIFPAGSQEGVTCVSVIARVHPDANKMAVSGELATLSCRYGLPERVHQVLWKKKIEQGILTVASYSRVHYHVEEALRSRMNLSRSLSDTKLVFQPVTIEDEACYTCEFHTFPDGTRTGSTCLSVYVLPEVKVTHATSPSGVTTANCSARSRPAAEITWSIGGYNQSLNTSLLFLNADGVTTVMSTLLLSSGQLTERSIQCVVRHQGVDKPLSVSLSNLSAVSPFIVNIILACGLPTVLILIGLF
ncbi:uncharacterized protein [Syngnathus scovelli]|uniref:uncharacterized protein isoform X2 n=1 Tax=Syngnathus scovelli TaxID=161590 RepID=UPI002110B82D|nr:uncharacterized protein LOC125987926 isoform X2 [Syngnathus scovelli]